MSDFRDRIRQHLDAGKTPERAYDLAVTEVDKDRLAEHFRPIGVDEARHMMRMTSRRIENHVFGKGGVPVSVTRSVPRDIDLRDLFAKSTWSRGDGTRVSWLGATRQDHRDRITQQEALIQNIEEDVERHRQALKVLDEKGAETLGDLDDDDLALVVA